MTKQLQLYIGDLSPMQNTYIFNPSIVHVGANVYMMVFRICRYDVPVILHPWSIWDNGYKYYVDPSRVMYKKYRPLSNHGGRIHLEPVESSPNRCPTPTNAYETLHLFEEYDSTGIATLSWTGHGWNVCGIQYQPFKDEMNQDARVCKVGDTIHITYNVFEHKKTPTTPGMHPKTRVTMRTRQLSMVPSLIVSPTHIEFNEEQYMFPHIHKLVEKNCVYTPWGDVLYEIGTHVKVYTVSGQWKYIPCPLLEEFVQHYAYQTVLISCSTPCIQYTSSTYLTCGHVKVKFKKLTHTPFVASIDWSRIKRHGKYIYFMMVIEFTREYKVLRCSRPFIPTRFNNHEPYLLVMPTGMSWVDGNVCITYGEGDVRSKCLFLSRAEMDSILQSSWSSYEPCFLVQSFTLYHYGYFGHFNCGDDAFKRVFEYIHQTMYPEAQVTFVNKKTVENTHPSQLLVIGGGDVLNDYFMSTVCDRKFTNVVATSVGIPYITDRTVPYISTCKHVVLRDRADAREYGTRHAPDYAFLLERIYPRHKKPVSRCIGMSLLQTYYHPEYTQVYDQYVSEMCKFIALLVQCKFTVVLIPFCTSGHTREDDTILYRCMIDKLQSTDPHVVSSVTIYNVSRDDRLVEQVYTSVTSVEFMICSRFHSHVFSTSTATPFMSVTCGRKCIRFMNQYGLQHQMFTLKKNDIDLPVHVDHQALFRFFNTCYKQRVSIRKQLVRLKSALMKELDVHLEEYKSWIRDLHTPLPTLNMATSLRRPVVYGTSLSTISAISNTVVDDDVPCSNTMGVDHVHKIPPTTPIVSEESDTAPSTSALRLGSMPPHQPDSSRGAFEQLEQHELGQHELDHMLPSSQPGHMHTSQPPMLYKSVVQPSESVMVQPSMVAVPVYQQPVYQQSTSMAVPVYQQPVYQQSASMTVPVYQQPVYQQSTSMTVPVYQQPVYQQSTSMTVPVYQSPSMMVSVNQSHGGIYYQQPITCSLNYMQSLHNTSVMGQSTVTDSVYDEPPTISNTQIDTPQ